MMNDATKLKIAMKLLKEILEEKNLILDPKRIKNSVLKASKELGVPVQEVAELVVLMINESYNETLKELDDLIPEI